MNHTKTAAIAKELLDGGKSATAETIRKQTSPTTLRMDDKTIISDLSPSKVEQNNNSISESKNSSHGIRAADQLLYLADLLQFEVFLFSNYDCLFLKNGSFIKNINAQPSNRFNSTTFQRVITAIT